MRAVWQLELLPASTLAAVHAAEAATKGYGGMYLTIVAAYGGQQEITDAAQSLLREQLVTGKTFEQAIALLTPDAIGTLTAASD